MKIRSKFSLEMPARHQSRRLPRYGQHKTFGPDASDDQVHPFVRRWMISSYIAKLGTLSHIRRLVSRLACYYLASYRAALALDQ
jgi:hypothetical protein